MELAVDDGNDELRGVLMMVTMMIVTMMMMRMTIAVT